MSAWERELPAYSEAARMIPLTNRRRCC